MTELLAAKKTDKPETIVAGRAGGQAIGHYFAEVIAQRRREPTDEKSWLARALARAKKDPKAALDDIAKALELNPRSYQALQNIAYVLGDEPERTPGVGLLQHRLEMGWGRRAQFHRILQLHLSWARDGEAAASGIILTAQWVLDV